MADSQSQKTPVEMRREDVEPSGETATTPEPNEYASGLKLFTIMLSLSLNTALVGLEMGIISTAIPGITDQFRRIQDVGWYGSATFLLVASSSSMWGKAFKYLDIKYAYLGSIVLLIIGSIVSAAAPNSAAVIIGRAIQGLGIGGSLSGSVIVINHVSHPRLHPLLIGIWTAVFIVSTILGPLIGGAFTSGVSWRWCFWINLPLGVPVIVLVIFFLHVPAHVKSDPATWQHIALQLDIPGFTLLLASLVCLALALQQGGQTEAWSAGSTVALLVLWPVLTIGFIIVEKLQGELAIVPLRLLRPRLTWANALYAWLYVILLAIVELRPLMTNLILGQVQLCQLSDRLLPTNLPAGRSRRLRHHERCSSASVLGSFCSRVRGQRSSCRQDRAPPTPRIG
jgi:MFS transporter, DHA2 family, glioxin efflux transporter